MVTSFRPPVARAGSILPENGRSDNFTSHATPFSPQFGQARGGGGGGAAAFGDTDPNTFIADAIIPEMSETVAGMMTVLDCLASWPNCSTYCSATRSCTASMPPSVPIAAATCRMPSAVAEATARMAWACPSASLICFWRVASDALMTCCFSPSAVLMAASR